ncbi:MAG: putative regulator of Ras-like GTPase activity (Roadblock/LC7/MglB family) [Arenicella sp.]|jgi:predicted regulator of Ras-like GTPase activity (Roadblock/LC7/MglB family)
MPNNKIEVKPELLEGIKDLCENNREVFLVSLCTTDGFSIKSFASKKLSAESDKLAAMSSTIAALSDSAAKQILKDQFNIAIVETNSGNMLLVRSEYLGLPCVLTVAARTSMLLATARYKTKKLAESINNIS